MGGPTSQGLVLVAEDAYGPGVTTRPCLMLVDDDTALAENLAEIMEGAGYPTLVADTADAALRVATSHNLGGVITDYRLPDTNGLELSRELFELSISVPVIILSAYADHLVRDSAKAMGVLDVVDKPISAEKLIDLAARLFAAHQAVLVVKGSSESPSGQQTT